MRRTLPTLALASTLVLSGCVGGGADSGDGGPARSDGLTPVRVAVVAVVDVAPLHLAREEGVFAAHGLEVEPLPAPGAAAVVPAVVNGDAEFGVTTVTGLLQAEAGGIPLGLVAPASAATGDPGDDFAAVVVPAGAPVRTAADLAGRRVAVQEEDGIGPTAVRESVRRAGGDAAAVRFVEVPAAEMVEAVETGRVDAALVVEPLVTLAEDRGLRVVAAPYTDTDPELTVAGYVTSDQYAAEHPDVVRRFAEAMAEAQRLAQEDPDRVREVLATSLRIPPEVAARLTLPAFPAAVDRDSVARLLELGAADGTVEGEVDLDDVLVDLQ